MPKVSIVNLAQVKASPTAEFPPFTTTTPAAEKSVEESTHAFGFLQIITRLIVAVILSAVLAFRPRKNVRLFERNLYVAQTQILLSVVAAALMMIVGDNTARAFAIFAAVSLVRFRTNIRDPKEVTILLICLAIGLSAGVGRWDLGLILCIFVLILLWGLELKEPDQAVRPMELTIKTRNIDSTNRALQTIFERFKLETEVRQLEAPDEKSPIGSIVHYLNLRLSLSTDYLSSQIVALDKDNIEGIQWQQKKSATDIYQ
ncbi:MAG: DUF4956 domain-containing protein [Pyrinomonadaceae bacterium]|nr:DUF4956 domain-containing protein [Pyrinomonadaceae bacterium]